jgi:hypothetical protein
MNETDNSNSQGTDPGTNSQATGDQSSQHTRVFDSVRNAFDEGARQARAAAEEAIPKIKEAVADATYWLGYSMSFAAVFSYTVATELAPEVLKAGARDGSAAGRKAAEDLASKRTVQAAGDTAASNSGSGPTPEPGLA